MKPTADEIERAMTTIAAMKFFPASETGIRLEVMELLRDMVAASEQMDWFRRTIRDKIAEWPGLAGMRGIFCAYHRPADGIDAESNLPGFTREDRNLRVESRLYQNLLAGYREDAKAITDGKEPVPLEPFVLGDKAREMTRRQLPRLADEERTRSFVTRVYGKGVL